MAGLLGMGGFGGLNNKMPTGLLKGNLAALFNPASMRNQQIKQGLLNAGIAMMNPDPHAPPAGIGGVLGRAAAGGFQGAQQAKNDFYQDGMLNMQLMDMQRQEDERATVRAEIDKIIPSLPPDMQGFARAYPQQFGEAYLKAKMPGEAKPPTVETFYDPNSGQSYKGQWNPQTQSWDRVGGNKADENGITITNPDGTVTQIGGSGGQKTTEADRRANLLIQQIVSQEPQLMESFDTLAATQNAIGGAAGTPGRAVMSGEAQNAKDSITNVVANWLYLTSGATATDDEVARQTAMVTPTIFDKPENIAAKKARLQSIIDTMKIRGNIQPQNSGNSPEKKRYRYNPETGRLE
jgi:hypothetical protein